MTELHSTLSAAFPRLHFESEIPLAPFTAIKIGGPAEVLVAIDTTPDLIAVVQFCREQQIAITMLGWGANTLIADRGIRGLVIRNLTKELTIDATIPQSNLHSSKVSPRHQSLVDEADFAALDYTEADDTPRVAVTCASGWPLPSLISALLTEGITGLQWYSRIPATLGGAIVNNIHGGTHFIGESIQSVQILTPANELLELTPDQCQFGYDYSRFHHSDEVILSAQLNLWRGDVERARSMVGQWAKQKSVQPQKSLGCVFQNLSLQEQQKLQLPTPSIGYLIDQVLHLKGKRIGDAQISQAHAAFIENIGEATAKQYLELAIAVQRACKEKLGVSLQPEIFFRGFEPSEIQELVSDNSL